MSTWVKEYQSKLVSPEKAVSVVKSGDWIGSSYAANVLPVLDKAMAARTHELFDIKLIGGVSSRIYLK